MQINVENSDYAVEYTAVNMDVAVTAQAEINVAVGDAARIDVGEALNYIKTGTSEIEAVVEEKTAAFNLNAEQKTDAFNDNAADKTSEYNLNAADKLSAFNENASDKLSAFNENASAKTNAFNDNATAKTGDFDDNATDKTTAFDNNASSKTTDFNDNATSKTNAFNQNATDKTSAFNLNATNKTTDFNNNYTAKKSLIDAEVANAEASATAAAGSANTAKQWAIGEPTEPSEGSAKYWAEQASRTLPNDGHLDIQVNGSSIATFTANQATNTTANIVVPDSATWGNITGTLSNQTDLNNALNSKQDVIKDLADIRDNATTGAGLAPQVEVNTQRIEDLTVAKFPNVVIVGTPHIEGGQVSNYSDTSYLQFPFVDISRGQPFDIYFSFTTAQDVTTQQNILDAYFGIALAIQNGKGIMALSSNGTSWDIGTSVGTNTLLPNTTYYVKYSWTGTEYSASLSTDDQTYVPDMNLASTLSPHKTTIFIGGSPNIFGAGSAHPFKGTINFNKSKVVVNGITVWEGMADVGLASRANVSLNNLDEVGEGRFNGKLDKVTASNKVYGTDVDGNQTTYDKNSFGQVDDVKVNGASVVTNKVADITVPGEVTEQTVTDWGFAKTSALTAKQDIATAVNYNNITNCITEIPQDIKLELNNGTLTLKAGSKVYVPNGVGVFDKKTTTQDITISVGGSQTIMVCVRADIANGADFIDVSRVYSGSTNPGQIYSFWYDTTNNLVKLFIDNTSTPARTESLPIAIITSTNGTVTSIDQVFNGFGYIGSTVFALPGVKGLVPNGRNADGSLKNIEVTTSTVSTYNLAANIVNIPMYILSNGTIDYFTYGTYFEDVNKNIVTNYNAQILGFEIGKFSTDSNRKITSFTPKTTFHAVDYNELNRLSSYHPPLLSSMWSDHLINDMNWLRADTFSWQSGDVYSAVYEELVSEFNQGTAIQEGTVWYRVTPKGYKITDIANEQNVINAYNNTGVSWYYILDIDNRRFKLPRTKFGFTGLRDTVGKYVAPSGTVNLNHAHVISTYSNNNGNFAASSSTLTASMTSFNGLPRGTRYWNGNGSTTTYTATNEITGSIISSDPVLFNNGGKITSVQPPATQMYLYFYVGGFSQTAIEQTAGLNAELFNGKADISASNLNSQGKSLISGLGMPSGRYINLTLGASGATYTAPANGWVLCTLDLNANCWLAIRSFWAQNSNSPGYVSILRPLRKGEVFGVEYNGYINTIFFRFIYAEGEN